MAEAAFSREAALRLLKISVVVFDAVLSVACSQYLSGRYDIGAWKAQIEIPQERPVPNAVVLLMLDESFARSAGPRSSLLP